MSFDASASWSGFNYQGKVALYHALTLINSLKNEEIIEYALLLENNEDFEITISGKAISYHQVKAYNSSSFSDYSNALIEMALELHKNSDVSAKIHTWKNINFKADCGTIGDSIKCDLLDIINEYKNPKAPLDGTTIIELAASSSKKIPKISAIIKRALPNMTADEICNALNDIHSGNNTAISRIQKYQYGEDCYCCSLNEINDKIKIEIKKWKQKQGDDDSAPQLIKAFHCFIGFIDNYVTSRHIAIGASTKKSIPFKEIISLLQRDHDDTSYEHLAFKFKEIFFNLIEEYMADPSEYTEPPEGTICNLKESYKILSSISSIELFELYRKFSPHIDLQNRCHTTNAINICTDGIRNVLIEILKEMEIKQATSHSGVRNFIYRSHHTHNKYFIPTTITRASKVNQIEKRILANPNLSDVFFEIENMIYDGDVQHTFSLEKISIAVAPLNDDDDEREKRSDYLKAHHLVPIDDAKKEINQ